MKARVNGVERELADGATVTDVLRLLDIPASGVAVALNGQVVPRAEHPRTVLADGADVEVLTAVQGG
ncbi:MAG: sulfur carrier protein ThiS [Kibdelosporangium sp.]